VTRLLLSGDSQLRRYGATVIVLAQGFWLSFALKTFSA
jgi:hypothetical protein